MTRKEILEKTIDFDDAINRIVRLEKENAELKSELHRVSLNEQLAIKNGKNFLKHIAELEKQVKDLEWQLQEVLKDNDNYQTDNERLEKENAELKHTIATLRQEKDNVSMHTKAMEVVAKTRSDNLTKAKEIIKKLLSRLNRLTYTGLNCEECKEAEQFISEVEK